MSFNVESGADDYNIELAYFDVSKGGAIGLNLHIKSGDALLRLTEWVKSGDKKGNTTYYKNKKGESKWQLKK